MDAGDSRMVEGGKMVGSLVYWILLRFVPPKYLVYHRSNRGTFECSESYVLAFTLGCSSRRQPYLTVSDVEGTKITEFSTSGLRVGILANTKRKP